MIISIFIIPILLLNLGIEGQTSQPVITSVVESQGIPTVFWTFSHASVVSYRIEYTANGPTRTQTAPRDAKSAILTMAQPCRDYKVKVIAIMSGGGAELPSELFDYTSRKLPRPPTPTNLNVVITSEGRILHWDGFSPYLDITELFIHGKAKNSVDDIMQSLEANRVEFPLTDFQYIHSYNITMASKNACYRSAESERYYLAAIEKPGPPTVTIVQPEVPTEISVKIDPNPLGGDADYYSMEYSAQDLPPIFLPSVNNVTQPIAISGLLNCTNYTITVFAGNLAGDSSPTEVIAFIESQSKAAAPTNQSVVVIEDGFEVKWDVVSDASRPIVQQILMYTDTKSNESHEIWIAPEARSATVRGVRQCTIYSIQVKTAHQCGWSSPSVASEQQTLPEIPPSPVTSLEAVLEANNEMLTWKGQTVEQAATGFDILIADGLEPARAYWASGSASSLVLPKLDPSRVYDVRMWSQNACGWSTASATKFTPIASPV